MSKNIVVIVQAALIPVAFNVKSQSFREGETEIGLPSASPLPRRLQLSGLSQATVRSPMCVAEVSTAFAKPLTRS